MMGSGAFHNDEVLVIFSEGVLLSTSWLMAVSVMRIIITAASITSISSTNANSW
jgi:hypothetical protein